MKKKAPKWIKNNLNYYLHKSYTSFPIDNSSPSLTMRSIVKNQVVLGLRNIVGEYLQICEPVHVWFLRNIDRYLKIRRTFSRIWIRFSIKLLLYPKISQRSHILRLLSLLCLYVPKYHKYQKYVILDCIKMMWNYNMLMKEK